MMLADPMTLTVDSVANEYAKVRTDATGAVRINTATDLTLPEYLTVRHSTSGRGDQTIDRHLCQFTRAERDADTGSIYTSQLNVTFVVPRVNLFSTAEIERLWDLQKELITAANLAKLLRGET